MSFKFENLNVWKTALELSMNVNDLVKSFPKEEMYVLTSQIKRASDSVSLNIAEGCTGQTDKEFNRFLGIALRSCVEVVGCIYLAKSRNLINQSEFDKLYNQLLTLTKMLQSFRKSLMKKTDV
ncbi:MAG: four helix bundle protein [Cyclobacteriaceae bacterium]